MSLRLRIILLAGVCILPSLILLAGTQWQLRQARTSEVQRQIAELARSEASEAEAIFGGARQFLTALERTPAIMDRNAPLCSAWLARLRRDFPAYQSIRADDIGGRLFCSSDPGRAGFDGDSPAFREVLQGGGFVVGARAAASGGVSELSLAIGIKDQEDRLTGMLAVDVDLRWLAQDLASRLPPDATVILLDGNGENLLQASSPGRRPDSTPADSPFIQSRVALSGGLQLVAARPAQTAFAALDRATRDGVVIIVVALLVACLVAAWLGTRFIQAPVRHLLATTDRLRSGDFSARSRLPGRRSELTQLAGGLNALAEELQERQRAQEDAEQRLRQSAATLEQRVAERTRALVEANQRLSDEAEQRQEVQAELTQMQKLDALGKLTGGIAHDFNNLLAAVLGSLELALSRVQEPRLKRLLEVAEQSAKRGAKLTAHLLAFSRKQKLVLRPLDVNGSVNSMADLLTRTLGKLIQLDYDLAEDLWPALADPVQLEVALLNLAINARDAMPDGGALTFRSRNVHVAEGPHAGVTLPTGDYVMVAVIDAGEGMPPEVQAKAFEPFFTTKGPGKGTGLGLSMVYGFARQAGGTVTIDSTPGRGTAISLYLPRAVTTAGAEAAKPSQPAVMPSLCVLLVDDDAMVRETTAGMLRELGHTVTEAVDGANALSLLGESYDVAVVDFAMPGMSGDRLASRLLELQPHLPVLMITGHADSETMEACSRMFGLVLQKPFSKAELAEALGACIGAARPA